MEAQITIHRPNLTSKEKELQMEKIKIATVNFLKEVQQHEGQSKKNQN